MEENQYLYRQVSYDHEPVFASGSMLGIKNCFSVLSIIDAAEKMGLDNNRLQELLLHGQQRHMKRELLLKKKQ